MATSVSTSSSTATSTLLYDVYCLSCNIQLERPFSLIKPLQWPDEQKWNLKWFAHSQNSLAVCLLCCFAVFMLTHCFLSKWFAHGSSSLVICLFVFIFIFFCVLVFFLKKQTQTKKKTTTIFAFFLFLFFFFLRLSQYYFKTYLIWNDIFAKLIHPF